MLLGLAEAAELIVQEAKAAEVTAAASTSLVHQEPRILVAVAEEVAEIAEVLGQVVPALLLSAI